MSCTQSRFRPKTDASSDDLAVVVGSAGWLASMIGISLDDRSDLDLRSLAMGTRWRTIDLGSGWLDRAGGVGYGLIVAWCSRLVYGALG